MLTSKKINAIKEIITILFDMHDHHREALSYNEGVNLRNTAWGISGFSVVLTAEDEWFILSVHSTTITSADREVCSTMNDTANGGTEDDGSIYGSDALEKVLHDMRTNEKKKYPILTTLDEDISAFLFQSQTVYSDAVTLALILQYYTYPLIKEERYLSYNISKLLKLSEEETDEVLDFVKNFRDSYDHIL